MSRGDRRQRHPADEVYVADVVEGVGDPVETPVALQQKPVDTLVVLVGLTADEGLDAHRVFADRQNRVGLQPPLAGQFDDPTVVIPRNPTSYRALTETRRLLTSNPSPPPNTQPTSNFRNSTPLDDDDAMSSHDALVVRPLATASEPHDTWKSNAGPVKANGLIGIETGASPRSITGISM